MFDDLNRTIEALLKAELAGDIAGQASVSFATPDDSFPPQGLSLPATNLFLFEVRENASLRELEPVRVQRDHGALERCRQGTAEPHRRASRRADAGNHALKQP